MNKIFNWTFGSIFRTIGRIIAYVLIGLIATFIVFKGRSVSDIKNDLIDSVKNWSFLRVNADSFSSLSFDKYYHPYNSIKIFDVYGFSNNCSSDLGSPCQMYHKTYFDNPITFDTTTTIAFFPGYILYSHLDTSSTTGYTTSNSTIQESTSDLQCFQPSNGVWQCTRANYGIESDTDYQLNTQDTYNGDFSMMIRLNFSSGSDYCTYSQGGFWCSVRSGRVYDSITFDLMVSGHLPQFKIKLNDYINGYYSNTSSIINDINNQTIKIENQTAKIEEGTNKTIEIIESGTNKTIETITDDTGPDISSLDNETMAGWLPPGPVDSILNMPLTLLNSIFNAMNGKSCSPLKVPLPFVNSELSIPCISSTYNAMGFGSFFNVVGAITSAFILFSYLAKLYKWVDDTLTFRENNHIDNWGGV